MRMTNLHAVAEVDSLPGCSQVAVIHSSFVDPKQRGKGHGKVAHGKRLRILAGAMMYDAAVCTTDASNAAEIAILKRFLWEPVAMFDSSKTGHKVILWFRPLTNATRSVGK